MRAFKTAYVMAMVILILITICLAIATYYPAPKRYDYPQYPATAGTDFNSPEYKTAQEKYNQDLKNYQEQNKSIEEERAKWSQIVFITILAYAAGAFLIGLFSYRFAPLLSTSLVFSTFIVVLIGPGLASFFSDSTPIPLLSQAPKVDLTYYKQIQFAIALGAALIGAVIGLTPLLGDKRTQS